MIQKSPLCEAIEKVVGFSVDTPADFERVSTLVFEWQHVTVSTSTLKRLWGYAGQTTTPRRYTLDTLARFVGYKDYEAFMKTTTQPTDTQSHLFLSDAFTADMLQRGDRLHLSWLPDRICVVEHQGGGLFRVVEARNAKLVVGDTFECHLFINHEPLYIDCLRRGSLPPMSYVAGRRDGVTIRKMA